MEGLIPMVYKSLKKSKVRRRYECLSTGSAQTYKIEDFYTKDDLQDHYINKYLEPSGDRAPDSCGPHHRRCNSVHVDGRATSFVEEDEAYKPNKQLVRFRSHRRMFSCVTG